MKLRKPSRHALKLASKIEAYRRRAAEVCPSIAALDGSPDFEALCAVNRVGPTRKQARKFVRRQGVWAGPFARPVAGAVRLPVV